MKKIFALLIVILTSFLLTSCKLEEKPNYHAIYKNDIYYSLFVRSFADSNDDGIGDLNGITENLDYLEELGVTAIWLLPIFESPSYHGYDTIDYFKINSDYGTMADLENLVDAANKKGIKIMLDLVINHTSDQHPWYLDIKEKGEKSNYYNYYARNKGVIYQSFPGGMLDLNLKNEEVITEIFNIVDYYVEKGIKGFRVDAVHHFFEELGPRFQVTENILFMNKLDHHLNTKHQNITLVGEVFQYDSQVLSTYAQGGNTYFDFYIQNEIKRKIGGNSSVPTFSRIIERHYSNLTKYNEKHVNSIFLGNHDMDRIASMPEYQDEERLKMAVRTLFTLPGSPYIYYGDEISLKGKRYEGDEINGRIVYDEYRRTPFLWGNNYETTWIQDDGSNEYTKNIFKQLDDPNSMFHIYQEMIKIRKNTPALMYGNKFQAYNLNNDTISYIISIADDYFNQKVLVVHNNSSKTIELDFKYKIIYGSNNLEKYQMTIYELPKDFQIEGA